MPSTRRMNNNQETRDETDDVVNVIGTEDQKTIHEYLSDYKVNKILLESWNVSKIYLFWVIIHVLSVNLYCYFCAPLSFHGLFISPFVAVAPHCKALSWLMNNSIVSINNMWLTLGTWFITKITITTNN
tara:strand:+ start:3435 stop:3821 length:387 start_codon:yes stop_codon:yes gene_type:complete